MTRGCFFALFATIAMLVSCGAEGKPTSDVPTTKVTGAKVTAAKVAAPATKPVAATAGTKEATKSGGITLDPDLPAYKSVAGVSGTIRSVGSDTMNNLMTKWGEGFKKYYPNVTLGVEGKGTGTAMPALENGASTFGPMSRAPKTDEITKFEKKFGYKPMVIPTSLDMLAVFVHKDNNIKGLTLSEIDAMFSATRKLGHKVNITTWGQLGLKEEAAKEPISLYGRNAASGTYGYFKEHTLGNGDFKDSVKVQPGSSGVIQSIATDKYGIGYSGIGYATADVRAVPLAREAGSDYIDAEAANAYNGTYPLWRPLLLAVNKNPTKELDPLRREFLKYVLSKEGQAEVVEDGYLPLPAKAAEKALADLGIK